MVLLPLCPFHLLPAGSSTPIAQSSITVACSEETTALVSSRLEWQEQAIILLPLYLQHVSIQAELLFCCSSGRREQTPRDPSGVL